MTGRSPSAADPHQETVAAALPADAPAAGAPGTGAGSTASLRSVSWPSPTALTAATVNVCATAGARPSTVVLRASAGTVTVFTRASAR
jgi:hypothetical protein